MHGGISAVKRGPRGEILPPWGRHGHFLPHINYCSKNACVQKVRALLTKQLYFNIHHIAEVSKEVHLCMKPGCLQSLIDFPMC